MKKGIKESTKVLRVIIMYYTIKKTKQQQNKNKKKIYSHIFLETMTTLPSPI